MPRKSPEVEINPSVWIWLRQADGASLADVAKKLKTDEDDTCQIERGERNPTMRELRTLSDYYRRPVTAFFLPEPPSEPPEPSTFRVFAGKGKTLSRKAHLAARETRYRQGVARELLSALDERTIDSVVGSARLDDDPNKVAARERDRFGITLDKQRAWKNEDDALKEWRECIQSLNVLVFVRPMEREDPAGFALTDESPSAIVINSSDMTHARIFTLAHEYGHILLGAEWERVQRTSNRAEEWCNTFAASLLMPESAVRYVWKDILARRNSPGGDLKDMVKHLSNALRVSSWASLIRLLSLKIVDDESAAPLLTELSKRLPRRQVSEDSRGGPAYCVVQRSQWGDYYLELVFIGLRRNVISRIEASEFLGMRVDKIDELESLLTHAGV